MNFIIVRPSSSRSTITHESRTLFGTVTVNQLGTYTYASDDAHL